MGTVHEDRCIVHCALCTVHCVLCTVHCALCTVHSALCTVHCVLCTVHCALCTVHCVLCTVYCVLCTLHCALCTVHCALCTVYCIFMTSLLILLRTKIISGKNCRKCQNTFHVHPPTPLKKNEALYKIMGKNINRAGQDTDDNIIWRMRIACWITKATDTVIVFNTPCFPTASTVKQRRHSVTFYVHFFFC